jgi:hypothetical protein
MPPKKPPFNYSKVRKVRLLKIGPQKTKSLFEEYFYGFAVAITLIFMVLGKAGGLDGTDSILTGLWVGGILWFGWVLKNYRKERAITGTVGKTGQATRALAQMTNQVLSPNMKPMIGPQWPAKTIPGAPRPALRSIRPAKEPMNPVQTPAKTQAPVGQVQATPGAPGSPVKRFVYERPTLPDRKPKLPANWADKQDKKPKR